MKKSAVLALVAVIGLSAILPLPAAAGQSSPQPKKENRIFIPKEVKTVLEAGLMSNNRRNDIPFAIAGNIYLPAVGAYHNVLQMTIKNAALGFEPAATPTAPPTKAEPAPKPEPAAAPQMQAKFEIFLQFREISGGLPGQLYKEVYVPGQESLPAAGYDANTTETYYLWYPLPAGKYLLAMALTTNDLKKIGTQYYEFNLPDPASFTDRLETTPIFSLKKIERLETPENMPILHRGFLTMAMLKIIPNPNNLIAPQDNFDIFFYIFGAKQNAEQKYALEMNLEVRKGEETAIRFAPAVFESPLVSLPLPMKHTVLKKTEAGEVKEEKNLEPGKYLLVIKILDKISGNTLTKNVDFEVK